MFTFCRDAIYNFPLDLWLVRNSNILQFASWISDLWQLIPDTWQDLVREEMMPCMINTQLCAQVKCKWSAIPSKASGAVSFELWSIEIDQDEIQYVCMYSKYSMINIECNEFYYVCKCCLVWCCKTEKSWSESFLWRIMPSVKTA